MNSPNSLTAVKNSYPIITGRHPRLVAGRPLLGKLLELGQSTLPLVRTVWTSIDLSLPKALSIQMETEIFQSLESGQSEHFNLTPLRMWVELPNIGEIKTEKAGGVVNEAKKTRQSPSLPNNQHKWQSIGFSFYQIAKIFFYPQPLPFDR